jgi:hypothetical protein
MNLTTRGIRGFGPKPSALSIWIRRFREDGSWPGPSNQEYHGVASTTKCHRAAFQDLNIQSDRGGSVLSVSVQLPYPEDSDADVASFSLALAGR